MSSVYAITAAPRHSPIVSKYKKTDGCSSIASIVVASVPERVIYPHTKVSPRVRVTGWRLEWGKGFGFGFGFGVRVRVTNQQN